MTWTEAIIIATLISVLYLLLYFTRVISRKRMISSFENAFNDQDETENINSYWKKVASAADNMVLKNKMLKNPKQYPISFKH